MKLRAAGLILVAVHAGGLCAAEPAGPRAVTFHRPHGGTSTKVLAPGQWVAWAETD